MYVLMRLQGMAEAAKNLEGANADQNAEALLQNMMASFEGNTEFESMMEGMMQQLMSKELLYQPMRELRDKYPAWLTANDAALSTADRERFRRQHEYVARICVSYEEEPNNYQKVVTLMHEMQEYGQPPAEIIRELAPEDPNDPNPLAALLQQGPGGVDPSKNPNCLVM